MRKNHSILDSNIYGTKYQILEQKHKRHREILNNLGYKVGLFSHIFDNEKNSYSFRLSMNITVTGFESVRMLELRNIDS